jgi:hypothetical protein
MSSTRALNADCTFAHLGVRSVTELTLESSNAALRQVQFAWHSRVFFSTDPQYIEASINSPGFAQLPEPAVAEPDTLGRRVV